MGAIIRDPKDPRKLARVGSFGDGAALGDGLVTNSLLWLRNSRDNVSRMWRGDEAGFAKVTGEIDILEITLSPGIAGALTAGDVACDTQEIPNAVRVNGGRAALQSITLLDQADQGISCRLVFLSRNVSLGTEDAAVSISAANAVHILGEVTLPTYADLINSRLAVVTSVGLILRAAPESRSIYVAMVTNGTPTYTADCLKLKLGLLGA